MKRLVLVFALFVSTACAVHAQGPAVPKWPADFTYVGKTVLATAPYPADTFGTVIGDFKFGKGLAVKSEADGSMSIFAASWGISLNGMWYPPTILRWKTTPVAGQFSGGATFIRSLGTVTYQGEIMGLHLGPTGDLFTSFNSIYDADGTTATTLSRSTLDPVTGKYAAGGSWKFSNRSDKMTMQGLATVPNWWRTLYHQQCDTLAGWGGYQSVIQTGPASMGPAATCFTLPTDAATPSPLSNVPVVGYPYSTATNALSMRRVDINYFQTYGWGWWPTNVTTGLGYWNPGDWLYQGCEWVDTPAVSGMVCFPELQEGCNWYGSNANPPVPPVCNALPGKAASLNSNYQQPWVVIYDPSDLGAVATGQKAQSSIQPVSQTPLTLPGITMPFPGLPNQNFLITGVSFEPSKQLLAVMLRDTSTSGGRPTIYWYHVNNSVEVRTPPRPTSQPSFH